MSPCGRGRRNNALLSRLLPSAPVTWELGELLSMTVSFGGKDHVSFSLPKALCSYPGFVQGQWAHSRYWKMRTGFSWRTPEEPQWHLCVKGWDCPSGRWRRHGLWWLNSTWLILSVFFSFNLIGIEIPRIGWCYQTKPIPSPLKIVSLLRMSCKALEHLFTH